MHVLQGGESLKDGRLGHRQTCERAERREERLAVEVVQLVHVLVRLVHTRVGAAYE